MGKVATRSKVVDVSVNPEKLPKIHPDLGRPRGNVEFSKKELLILKAIARASRSHANAGETDLTGEMIDEALKRFKVAEIRELMQKLTGPNPYDCTTESDVSDMRGKGFILRDSEGNPLMREIQFIHDGRLIKKAKFGYAGSTFAQAWLMRDELRESGFNAAIDGSIEIDPQGGDRTGKTSLIRLPRGIPRVAAAAGLGILMWGAHDALNPSDAKSAYLLLEYGNISRAWAPALDDREVGGVVGVDVSDSDGESSVSGCVGVHHQQNDTRMGLKVTGPEGEGLQFLGYYRPYFFGGAVQTKATIKNETGANGKTMFSLNLGGTEKIGRVSLSQGLVVSDVDVEGNIARQVTQGGKGSVNLAGTVGLGDSGPLEDITGLVHVGATTEQIVLETMGQLKINIPRGPLKIFSGLNVYGGVTHEQDFEGGASETKLTVGGNIPVGKNLTFDVHTEKEKQKTKVALAIAVVL
ncbi:MAG: hypothetical protein ABH950_01795 [Candidatus Altiarchaeota archaeon]